MNKQQQNRKRMRGNKRERMPDLACPVQQCEAIGLAVSHLAGDLPRYRGTGTRSREADGFELQSGARERPCIRKHICDWCSLIYSPCRRRSIECAPHRTFCLLVTSVANKNQSRTSILDWHDLSGAVLFGIQLMCIK